MGKERRGCEDCSSASNSTPLNAFSRLVPRRDTCSFYGMRLPVLRAHQPHDSLTRRPILCSNYLYSRENLEINEFRSTRNPPPSPLDRFFRSKGSSRVDNEFARNVRHKLSSRISQSFKIDNACIFPCPVFASRIQ